MDPGEVEGLFQLFDMTTTELQALIAAVEKSGPLAGIIHGDFNDRNLLAQDGRLTAVVDWDDCGFGWLMTDVAIAMPAPTARLARVRQFVDLYVEAGGPLEAPSIDMLLQLKRCSTLNEVFWTVDDVDGAWLLHPRSATILREVALDLRRLESARRRLEHRGLARTSAGP
jgi:Ser/Thr protein kinase RdoA (MazF antagonist)